jgi:hypothetical protein
LALLLPLLLLLSPLRQRQPAALAMEQQQHTVVVVVALGALVGLGLLGVMMVLGLVGLVGPAQMVMATLVGAMAGMDSAWHAQLAVLPLMASPVLLLRRQSGDKVTKHGC